MDKCFYQRTLFNKTIEIGNVNETCPQHEFWYGKDNFYPDNFVQKYDLVCSREYFRTLALSISGVAEMLGCFSHGFLSDRFGRKTDILLCSVIIAIGNFIIAFSSSPYMIVIGRFVSGTSTTSLFLSSFTMATELFPPKQRSFFSTGTCLFWAGYCTFFQIKKTLTNFISGDRFR